MSSDNRVSRRDLFLGAGMTAGALAAIGAVGGVTYAPATQAALSKSRLYFASNVALELDGISAGKVVSAEGGEPVIETRPPPTSLRYQELTVRLGDMSPALYDWVGKVANGATALHSVSVITSNLDAKEIYRLKMQDVRLTEVRLDELDASKVEPARFTVKMAPGTSAHQFGGKGADTNFPAQKVSPILRSNFRLYIQGIEAATSRAKSIDTVGMQFGGTGLPIPLVLRFSVPFADAGPLFAWMQDTLAGKGILRQGELQLLTRDLAKVASSVTFNQLMIVRISCPAEAASGSIQHAEVECVPTSVSFNMGELLR